MNTNEMTPAEGVGAIIGETEITDSRPAADIQRWLFEHIKASRIYKIKNIFNATFSFFGADPENTRRSTGEMGPMHFSAPAERFQMAPNETQDMVGWKAQICLQSMWGFYQQQTMKARGDGKGVSNPISATDLDMFLAKATGGEANPSVAGETEGLSEPETANASDEGAVHATTQERRLANLAKARVKAAENRAAKKIQSVEEELGNA